MAGFALPKLRWLVLGALAAGGWAAMQEAPKSLRHDAGTTIDALLQTAAPRAPASARLQSQPSPTPLPTATPTPSDEPARVAAFPPAPKAPPQPVQAVRAAAQPTAGPELAQILYTTDTVRMRKTPATSGDVVGKIAKSQAATVVAKNGEWRQVVIGQKTGWIRADYLAAAPVSQSASGSDLMTTAGLPRPKVDVGAVTPVSQRKTPVSGSSWDAMRPARTPQTGDCQCPYDLMVNGNQCGARSAYVRTGGTEAACYF